MKVAKCDICGKTAIEFYQVKYRRITNEKTSETKSLDICTGCFKKAVTATGQKKMSVLCHTNETVI